jgi:hypothetical protein
MIEVAKEVRPFVKADEVLASDGRWVVIVRATGAHLIACRIRRPLSRKSAVLTVRIDAARRYGDICWIRGDGSLRHKGLYAHAALGYDSREWRIVQRLFANLVRGTIPDTVTIVPDEAFERERCLKFQLEHSDIWQWLILKDGHDQYHKSKLALIKRFGQLTEAELQSIRDTRRIVESAPVESPSKNEIDDEIP